MRSSWSRRSPTAAQGVRGITSFIVTKETSDREAADRVGVGHAPELEPFTPGVRAGRKEDKMGWRASDTRELYWRTRSCPPRTGWARKVAASAISCRPWTPAVSASARCRSGSPRVRSTTCSPRSAKADRLLAEAGQGTQFTLAEMATEIAAARHLVYHAAWLKQNGQPFTSQAAMAKLFASELAMRVTTRAVQLLGTRRLLLGVPRRADAARRQGLRDRRGYQRGPEDRHCPRP